MSSWAIWIVTILYAYTGLEKAYEGNWYWAVVWLSYATANFALMGAMKSAIH